MTTGGTCKDVEGETSAGAFDFGGVDRADETGTAALGGAREVDCSASVGMADASIDDPGFGDATSERERDGNTVEYSVFVMTTRDEEFAVSEADAEGSTATDVPLVVAEAIGMPEVPSAAEVDVWTADSITEDALKTAELAVLFVVCRP
jgi:hypothetical protein